MFKQRLGFTAQGGEGVPLRASGRCSGGVVAEGRLQLSSYAFSS